MKIKEIDVGAQVAWEDKKGNLLTGKIFHISERFYAVSVIGATMKRRNYKPIPVGTKYLVPKKMVQFQ